MENLVEITKKDFDVIFDLRYASDNNVCQKKLYSHPFCYLHKDAIEPFKKAISFAKELGYKIKIFDAFRPFKVQQFMFDKFPSDDPNGGFVSNPKTGAVPHCRGVAIDLTLCNKDGMELEMGSDFDEFSPLAFHDYSDISNEALQNRKILLEIMTRAGFDFYSKEWWHYQLFEPRKYPIVKVSNDLVAI